MIKPLFQLGIVTTLTVMLSACQSVQYSQIKNVKENESTQNNALIYCDGTESCEFERFNQIEVTAENSHRISKAAVSSQILRLGKDESKYENQIYLSVQPGLHEVVIRFYPISKEKAEKLHVIHNFLPKQFYTFEMYRDRTTQNKSLLNASAPEPLCVKLKQGDKTIRRFCRPYNVLTGLGEFVEKKS